MKMYVGNCTKQIHDFVYRVPESNSPRRQTIGIGEQVLLSGDLSQLEVDYILRQHEKYGLVRVDEIDSTRQFIGLCWSERPIPDKRMVFANDHNTVVLVARGNTMRRESAVALNNYVENQHEQSGLPGGVRQVEVAATEQSTPQNPDPRFAEGIRVTRGQEASPPPRASRRGRRAA